MLWNEDFEEAKRLVDFALTLKGSNKGMLYLKKTILLEYKRSYNQALKFLKEAKMNAFDSDFMDELQLVKTRIKSKMPKKKKKAKEQKLV